MLEVLGLKVVGKWEHGWRLSCGAALVVCPCCSRSILIGVLAILRAIVVVLFSEVEIVGTVRLVIFSCCLSGCGAPCYTVLEVSGSTELGVQMATGTLNKAGLGLGFDRIKYFTITIASCMLFTWPSP